MNFLVDAQLPPGMARWLSSHGHGGTHVFDIGLQAASDPVIWEHARKSNAVIISKDEDFVDRWLLSDAPVAADLDSEGQLFEPRIDGVV